MSPTAHRGIGLAIAIALAAGPVAGTAMGQLAATGLLEDGPESWEQTHKLLPDAAGAHFGDAVAMDGEDFIVGAPAQEKVYVYKDTDDGPVRQVFPATPEAANLEYGTAVDLDGDLAAVGANGNAFVFERVSAWTWEHVGTLTPPANPEDSQRRFGISIAVDGETNTAIVGAPYEDTDAGENAGAAFVYSPEGGSWTLDATLSPDNPAGGNQFGAAVAVEGTTTIVGAPWNPDAGTATLPGGFGVPEPAGAAFVFQGSESGWTQTAKLVGSQPTDDLFFGATLAIHDDRVLIGADDTAYVFDTVPATNPSEVARLVPDDRPPTQDVRRGSDVYTVGDVGLDGDTALLGGLGKAFVDEPVESVYGEQVYLFQEDSSGSWSQATELAQRDPESHAGPRAEGSFGEAVAVDGDRALVGGPLEDSLQGQRDGGAAYVFSPCTALDGPLSGPIHDDLAPQTGPAQEDVHDVNCNWITSNGG